MQQKQEKEQEAKSARSWKSVQKISNCEIKNRRRKKTGENCLKRKWIGTEKNTIRKKELKMIQLFQGGETQ
jgi:hypothetical protein